MKDKKIAIIGCGNLGLSILNGLLDEQSIKPSNIIVTRRNIDALDFLKPTGINLSSDNVKAVKKSEIIIVALKPYNILDVIKEIAAFFDPKKHILVSLATGISIEKIQHYIKVPISIFRAMPNTASDVGESTTCICSNSNDFTASESIRRCFSTIGSTIMIDENLMDSATVLGACGIAYVLRFIRGMIQDGIQIGFDAKTASEIVTHTV